LPKAKQVNFCPDLQISQLKRTIFGTEFWHAFEQLKWEPMVLEERAPYSLLLVEQSQGRNTTIRPVNNQNLHEHEPVETMAFLKPL
jgi:hypothetical protein